MIDAGVVHNTDGAVEVAIWEIMEGWLICKASPSGDIIVKIKEKDFRRLMTYYCQSDPTIVS